MRKSSVIKENLLLILGLGALALVRPVMKMTGIMDFIGQSFGSILMTIVISLAWLVIVLARRVPHPVSVLVYAGMSYALFAIILSGIASPILNGELQGPLTNPFAVISVFAVNALWGLIVGGMMNGINRYVKFNDENKNNINGSSDLDKLIKVTKDSFSFSVKSRTCRFGSFISLRTMYMRRLQIAFIS